MKDFWYIWSTLFLTIYYNLIRNIAILKNKLFIPNLDNHLQYYSNLNILNDNWFEQLPKSKEEQKKFLRLNGIEKYMPEVFFYDFLLKNYKYTSVVDFGCGNGRLSATLAALNPDIKFTCTDVNIHTEKLNQIYLLDNIKFTNLDFELVCKETDKDLPRLVMARMSLAYLNPESLKKFINICSEKDLDLAIADITRYKYLTDLSRISYTQNSQPVYAHPYEKLLCSKNYIIDIDVQKHSSLMNLSTYLFPEYLTFILARK